jgi:AraC-like DNA-binding protein
MRPVPELNLQYGFSIQHDFPRNFKGMKLSGAVVTTATGKSGMMVLQEYKSNLFHIRFNFYKFFHDIQINGHLDSALLMSLLALKNEISYSIKGLGTLYLKQGEFGLLHSNEHEVSASFEGNKEYKTIEVAWPRYVIQKAIPVFPELKALFTRQKKAHSFFLRNQAYAGRNALYLTSNILNSPFDAGVSGFYFECKVTEYLIWLLAGPDPYKKSKVYLTEAQEELLNSFGEKLHADLKQKFPIYSLADKLFMHPHKLQKAFKERYGKSIFNYQLDMRMQEAHRLLEETKLDTLSIARMVGYKHSTSFIDKFSEYFGYPPGEIMEKR